MTWKVFGGIGVILVAVLAFQIWYQPSAPSASQAPKEPVAAPAPSPQVAPRPNSKLSSAPQTSPETNKYFAPDFDASDVLSGHHVKLSSYLGKVVIIDFWATWCGPCRMEIPDFVKLNQKYHDKGFRMIGVSIDQSGVDSVVQFAKAWSMNYPIIVDPQGFIAQSYSQVPPIGEIRGFPTSVIVGRDGSVLESLVGYRPPDVFEALVQEALAAPYTASKNSKT